MCIGMPEIYSNSYALVRDSLRRNTSLPVRDPGDLAMTGSPDITAALAQMRAGDQRAVDEVTLLLYTELRRMAAGYLRHERDGHTLEPTALVHEAYVRLVGQRDVAWQNRAHFLGVAAQCMRRILIDHARGRARSKRGGLLTRVTLNDDRVGAESRDMELIALDDALRDLGDMDPELAKVVELRSFGGLTVEETAEVLGISPSSVDRAWSTARAWLRRHMRSGEES